ncbi:hypothetical protein CPLU01_12330 [Colletotrichum plurivorum]|uniref:Uncharacterized protein n=1 Tax=Colletotrichum plurivorum TaxID=2175906 RepID=A0A8H6JYS2_9PEZI|nr:hypothetical protein CPLU01_12330 [Colletotrichum plurivorum]
MREPSTPDGKKSTMFSVAGPVSAFHDRGTTTSWDFKPVVPSPLSSSNIRATSPLSPRSDNAARRQTQSSPIPAPKFKFASRPTRPNPVVRKREDAQESRRKMFLQNVRQRADDKAYQRRDMEGTLLKSDWDRDMRQRFYAKQIEGDAVYSEADIEDAADFSRDYTREITDDIDDLMIDDIAQQEQAELDALVSSYGQDLGSPQQQQASAQSDPYNLSDDEDYDALFMDLVSQETNQDTQMDMS